MAANGTAAPTSLARIGTRIGRVPIERRSQHGEAKRLTELIGALQAISAKAPGPDMPDPDVVHDAAKLSGHLENASTMCHDETQRTGGTP